VSPANSLRITQTTTNAKPYHRRSGGVSLLELLLVLAVIAFLSAVIVGDDNAPSSEQQRSNTANAVMAALIHARQTASYQGQSMGIWCDTANQQLKVFRLDHSSNPPNPVYDVRHPLSQQIYTLSFETSALPARLEQCQFNYQGYGSDNQRLDFQRGSAAPVLYLGGGPYLLTSGSIELSLDQQSSVITIYPQNGSVVLQ